MTRTATGHNFNSMLASLDADMVAEGFIVSDDGLTMAVLIDGTDDGWIIRKLNRPDFESPVMSRWAALEAIADADDDADDDADELVGASS